MDQNTNPNQPQVKANDAMTLMSIESLVVTHNTKLNDLKKEMTQYKEMIDDILDGSPEYQQKNEACKLANKEKSAVKKQLLNNSEAVKLLVKVKEYKDQMKELKQALSDYLKQYEQLAGTNTIETPDGIIREIVYTAHLIVKQK